MKALRAMAAAVWLAVAAGGCGEQGGELREATERRRAMASPEDSVVADSAPPPSGRLPAFVLDDTVSPTGAATDSTPAAPATDTAAAPPAPSSEWTSARTEVRRRAGSGIVLRGVRTGVQKDFDRLVFVFGDAPVPGYRVEYVSGPPPQCGSGSATSIAGDGWLAITFRDTQAHDDQGRSTVSPRERRTDLPVVEEWEITCDFEGEVQVVAGVSSPNAYRILELSNPSRLTVDVQH